MISKFDLDLVKLKYYGPSNYSFFNGVKKHMQKMKMEYFLRYLLKKK